MIWIISAMMWYQDIDKPIYTDYILKTFETKQECLDFVFWNKVDLVMELAEEKGTYQEKQLKTWAFYCENRKLKEV
mgnify:FL=1|tara:strand:- start:1408 stop:1635 length:228 start_codon:yes stop_codon:yes gene_type:complete